MIKVYAVSGIFMHNKRYLPSTGLLCKPYSEIKKKSYLILGQELS